MCPVGTKRYRWDVYGLTSHHSLSETMSHPPNQPLGSYSSKPTTLSTILTTTSTHLPLSNSNTPASTTSMIIPYPSTTAFALVLIRSLVGSHPRQRLPLVVIIDADLDGCCRTYEIESGTAGPPPPNNMSLHCLCEGSSSVFLVQVCHDTTIVGLIEQVQKNAGLGALEGKTACIVVRHNSLPPYR
jgi:hypothetical protein